MKMKMVLMVLSVLVVGFAIMAFMPRFLDKAAGKVEYLTFEQVDDPNIPNEQKLVTAAHTIWVDMISAGVAIPNFCSMEHGTEFPADYADTIYRTNGELTALAESKLEEGDTFAEMYVVVTENSDIMKMLTERAEITLRQHAEGNNITVTELCANIAAMTEAEIAKTYDYSTHTDYRTHVLVNVIKN